jgi:hypothetical protein
MRPGLHSTPGDQRMSASLRRTSLSSCTLVQPCHIESENMDANVFEFTVEGHKQSRRGDLRIHRGVLPRSDWTKVSDLPVTTPARTVVDLAAARIDGGQLAVGARDGRALVKRLLNEAGIPAATEQLAHDRALDLRTSSREVMRDRGACSIRAWQAQGMLGDVVEDHFPADGRDPE